MGKAIPDRWLNYRPIGERIAGTRFIAFKVPLRENINEGIDDEQLRLAPHSLLESVPNLGLIVDLTNTNRYYNPQTFTDQNVAHQKLMIPGHQTPPKELAQRFCQYVTSFLEANPDNDKLIGVHCTHGVNRTGYLICYFMITKMNMSPKLAIQTFADARGHKIERENYTKSLRHLDSTPDRTRQHSESSSHRGGRHRPRDEPHETRIERRYDDKSENWRNRQQDQNGWQQRPPLPQPQQQSQQWRNPRNDSQNNGWQQQQQHRQPQRWRQEAHSEETAHKQIRHNDYQAADNGRYREQSNWQPRQNNRLRHVEDQGYGRSSNGSYNNYRRYNNNNSSNNNNNNSESRQRLESEISVKRRVA
ncbi:uncharacterized protein Dvir_GJ20873 [Drosophila virilis]|uniref:Uncharacterized protein n=1 Tax=Drosophila virilis TaxID=7244 RepID=B4LIV8_DROVI|nr:uncharacterized protein Dvir_GJ20873 [Drosophila virilis]